jgi:hypothetical protein
MRSTEDRRYAELAETPRPDPACRGVRSLWYGSVLPVDLLLLLEERLLFSGLVH